MRMIRMFSRSPDRWLFEYACSDEVGAASDYLDKRNDAIKRIQRAIADNTADMIKYDSAAAEAELSGDDSMGMSLRKLHKESQDTAQYFKIKLEQLTNGENG